MSLQRRDEVVLNRLRINHTQCYHACQSYEKRTTKKMSKMLLFFIKYIITECRDKQDAQQTFDKLEHHYNSLGIKQRYSI